MKKKILSYAQCLNYLNSFINYERKNNFSYQRDIKLQRVRALLNSLGIDYKKLNCVHIAGTKGKGSVATFLSDILTTSYLKVGVYTSPHFLDFRERIIIKTFKKGKIINKKISPSYIINFLSRNIEKIENLRENKNLGNISFFEIYTALGFSYFLEKKVDIAVIEVGLGGRLDATNIIKPFVSIITHIGYDHTKQLGSSLEKIAYEKAGIIKNEVPAVSASQRPLVMKVIKKVARKKTSKLFFLGRDFYLKNLKLKKEETFFDFFFVDFALGGIKITLKGKHQAENASLALAAARLLEKNNPELKFNYKIIARTFLEGRLEVFSKKPLLVFDIAHNPSSFSALSSSLRHYFKEREIILIFSASRDKDVVKMLKSINCKYIIFTCFSNPRCLSPYEAEKKAKNIKSEKFIIPDLKKALQKANSLYTRRSLILVSGSFFLVAEAKKIFKNGFKFR